MAFISSIDVAVEQMLAAAREPAIFDFFVWVSKLANTSTFIVLMALIVSYLAYSRQWRNIVGLFISAIGSGAATFLLKNLISRARPDLLAYPATGFAFPSGHATRAVAFYGFLLFILWPRLTSMWKKIALIITALIILGIGFSRLYLGVHYLSDVVAGYLIGAFFVWLGIKISRINLSK